ncbi:hypothetical protein N7474_001577 [Penicillium riverlandense]|uniref:uncharacterized protein n=1 Tax=Penicillium riverlandense TaxID=1903569 RepID=UPI0025498512|nr:uncharacterized protein N7474_001577 [Penicillium riverlandense]KAJ5833266.1 hypothetical protein N7474_001577 [Penicillium riverlandense]
MATQFRNTQHVEVSQAEEDITRQHTAWAVEDISQAEHNGSLRDAVREHWRSAFWAFIFSLSIVMDGYDLQLVYSLLALPQFQKAYGEPYNGGYQLKANWQTALNVGSPVGRVIGGILVAWISDRFSRKTVMAFSLVLTAGCVFITFFAPNIQILVAGEMIIGLFWGFFNTLAPTYSSELCPVALRGILMSFILTSWGIGQLIAQGVIKSTSERPDSLSYRIPFAVQWVWPVIILAFLPFAPESPWWLVQKGRMEDAAKALRKLGNHDEQRIQNQLLMMDATNKAEIENEIGTSWWDCFKNENLRRTEIVSMAWAIQALCGNSFQGYGIYFLEQAGFPVSLSFSLGVGQSALSVFGSCLSWVLIRYSGRRPIFFWGLVILTCIMFIIAILDVAPGYNTTQAIPQAQGSLLIIWAFFFFTTVAAVSYIIVGETSATRLRSKTTALGSSLYSAVGIAFGFSTPDMLNPTALGWRGKTGFWFGSLSLLCCIWAFFRLPECKGRTYKELDHMFAKDVPARKFKTYQVPEERTEVLESKLEDA